jgi:signal transduction histidine kinase
VDRPKQPFQFYLDKPSLNDYGYWENISLSLRKMLSFSKSDQEEKKAVDVDTLLDEILLLQKNQLQENNIKLKTKFAQALLKIKISKNQPIFDVNQFLKSLDRVDSFNVPVIAEVIILRTAGMGRFLISYSSHRETS